MNINSKKRVFTPIALIILCASIFTCTAFIKVPTDNRNEVSSETTTAEQVVTTTETYVENETQTTTEETTETVIEPTEDETKHEEYSTRNTTQNNTDTKDDLFYLAAAVCREAGGESEEMQLLVANVIINRVNSSLYPNTIYDVLTQPGQYGTMSVDGISFPSWADNTAKTQCYNVASRILNGERYCPENVLFQAEFKQGSGVYKHIGNMYFCYY
jgi:spore germination cell wall hydrolase CwlJ-like protein